VVVLNFDAEGPSMLDLDYYIPWLLQSTAPLFKYIVVLVVYYIFVSPYSCKISADTHCKNGLVKVTTIQLATGRENCPVHISVKPLHDVIR
jgi:hypothetical protein